VVSGRVEAGTAKSAALMAVDKLALNAQLAHTYVMELMDKARIA
jgi:hypothetical protein